MNYQPYSKKKDTPSRMTRKQGRSKTWAHNSSLAALKRREKKAAKRAARLAEEGDVEE